MHEILIPWLLAFAAVLIVLVHCRRRWNRLVDAYRKQERYADTLLQHLQGTILQVQGITNDLRVDDPVRQRVEYALERSDKRLAQVREELQPVCSERQEGRIQ